jgi:hypothetical protein
MFVLRRLERASTGFNRIRAIKTDIRRDAGTTLDRRQGDPPPRPTPNFGIEIVPALEFNPLTPRSNCRKPARIPD